MANTASISSPAPGAVTAGAPIANIEVSASGTDTVDPPSSDIGTIKNGVYSQQANLAATGTPGIFVPDASVVAPTGAFTIHANVQFTSGGMPTQNVPADSGTFDGVLTPVYALAASPKSAATKKTSTAKRAKAKPAKAKPKPKASAKKAKKPAAKSAAKAKAKPAAKRKLKPAAKRKAAKPKKKK